MGRFIGPETVEIWFGTTVSVLTAPTSTELNAFTDFTGFVVDGGADFPTSGNTVDAADLSSKFDKVIAGTRGGDEITLTMHRDDVVGSDTAYTTLVPATVGYFATAPRGLATAGTWAIGDAVNLYKVEVITRNEANLAARGATQQFTITAAVTDDPTIDFALVA